MFLNKFSCLIDKKDQLHMFGSVPNTIIETFSHNGKLVYESFAESNRWLHSPLPLVHSSSPVRCCAAANGVIHYFYFDIDENLINVHWQPSIKRWNFAIVSSALTQPKFAFPGKQWTLLSLAPAWDFTSLACTSNNDLIVYCNCEYKIPSINRGNVTSTVVFTFSNNVWNLKEEFPIKQKFELSGSSGFYEIAPISQGSNMIYEGNGIGIDVQMIVNFKI